MADTTGGDRIRAVMVIIATFATIAFNTLASSGYVNGVTPEIVSGRYPTIITPAGYAFAIWNLIYLGLIAFSIYQVLPANVTRFRSVRTWYIVSCMLNCTWIYAFHFEQIGICLVIILMLAASLQIINFRIKGRLAVGDTWLAQAPLGIYFGWVTAAALVNLMVYFKSVGSATADSPVVGAVIIIFAAVCAVIVRVKIQNFFYPLAIAWALTAIAVAHSSVTRIVVAAAIGVVICLIATGSFVTGLRDSSTA